MVKLSRTLVLCAAAVVALSNPAAASSFKVGAFNVQVFGRTKSRNADVIDVLAKTFLRWDLSCMQEIRNSDGTAFPVVLDALNAEARRKRRPQYKAWLSERLGRSSSKEQQAYIYREDMFEVVDTYQYADTRDDFERPPNAVLFRRIGEDASRGVSAPFWVMCQHITPGEVAEELQSVAEEVIPDAVSHFRRKMAPNRDRRGMFTCERERHTTCSTRTRLSAGILMGDFNAGCSYLRKSESVALDIMQQTSYYTMAIPNTANTTVGKSQCAYDRIVAVDAMQPQLVASSGRVFDFQQEFHLTDAMTKEVSDHFPVEADVVLGALAPVKTAQDARTAWREVRMGIQWANTAWCGGGKMDCLSTSTIRDEDQVVVVDLFETSAWNIRKLQNPKKQKLVVCAFSAGTVRLDDVDAANFTSTTRLADVEGRNAKWLNMHYSTARKAVLRGMEWRMKHAQLKGCDAALPMDVECWSNPSCLRARKYDSAKVAKSQITYNRVLAEMAHAHDMSVGLMNDVAQVAALVDSFDFAVNEECHRLGECDAYTRTFAAQEKAVLGSEYEGGKTTICRAAKKVGISQKVDGGGLWENCDWNAGVRVAQAYVRGRGTLNSDSLAAVALADADVSLAQRQEEKGSSGLPLWGMIVLCLGIAGLAAQVAYIFIARRGRANFSNACDTPLSLTELSPKQPESPNVAVCTSTVASDTQSKPDSLAGAVHPQRHAKDIYAVL